MMLKDDKFDSLALCEAASIEENSDRLDEDEIVDEETILLSCGSLIRLLPEPNSQRKRFQFAHFTVQEYLESDCSDYQILNSYGISLDRAKKHIMQLSLQFLNLKNFEKQPQRDQDATKYLHQMYITRPFYKIASICWWSYEPEEIDGIVRDHLRTLFRKTPNFCRWAEEVCRQFFKSQHCDRSFDIQQVIYNIARPDFTPLHMAAALGCIDVCRQLLRDEAKMDLMSKYGTPLHFAVGGLAVFAKEVYHLVYHLQTSPLKRRGIVDMLLKEGIQRNLRLDTPLQKFSLMNIALTSTDVQSLYIVADLIRHGILVEETDLGFFIDMYDTWEDSFSLYNYDEPYCNGAPVLNLLDALTSIQPSDPQQTSAQIRERPEVSLYDITFNFAKSLELDISTSLVKSTISGDLGSLDLSELVYTALKNNDTKFIETIYLSEGSKQVGLFDQQSLGFSVLHTAIEEMALNCLELLLEWGLDPNVRDKSGRAPIHLCYNYHHHSPYLCMLLEYGSNSFALDDKGDTIWHVFAAEDMNVMLKILIQQKEWDAALHIISGSGDTPICRALIRGHQKPVALLLRFCDKKEHWRCSEPIYRAAAKLGSAEVIQKLVEVGVQYDTIDECHGNPLHWINPMSDLKCIEILKSHFPLDQRRESDSRTPFESLLLRAFRETKPQPRNVEVAMGLLSGDLVSSSNHLGTVWSFLCAEVISEAILDKRPLEQLGALFTKLLKRGVASSYEEHFQRSSLEPLAQCVCRNTVSRLRHLMSKNPMKDPLPVLCGWDWFSQKFHLIADDARHTDKIAKNPIMAQLLCEAIIHGDQGLLKLLLEFGVDCHFRTGVITPLELACLPGASENGQTLRWLLDYTTPESLARGGSYTDLGFLHLTAGLKEWGIGPNGSMDKLKCLLDAGADPNLISSNSSPMTYHISQHSIETAEALLDAGADPWLRVSESWDSVLMAILSRNWTFLTKVLGHSTLKKQPPQSSQIWTVSFNDGNSARKANALHLAALVGGIDEFKFYLDNHLLTDLNTEDGDGQTPMHYAASAGLASVVKFLVELGANINAKSKSDMTPLNLAIQRGHTECVRTLLVNGAGQQVIGHSPFIDAYYSGNGTIINLLQVHLGEPRPNSSIRKAKAERKMASSLMLAMKRGDVDTCRTLLNLGCHIDIEIELGLTPLFFAVLNKSDIRVVEWLLDSNAKVSSTSRIRDCSYTAFQVALMTPWFNPLIAIFVAKYLEENEEFLVRHGNPLHYPLASGNTKGLIILVEEISKNHKKM
jgi:ankyrin repeat protein